MLLVLAKSISLMFDKNVSVKSFFKFYTCIQESPPVLRVTSYNMCPVTQPFNIDQIVREVSIFRTLKGLGHEIEFKHLDDKGSFLVLIRASTGF
jgi:hypothetical protein